MPDTSIETAKLRKKALVHNKTAAALSFMANEPAYPGHDKLCCAQALVHKTKAVYLNAQANLIETNAIVAKLLRENYNA